MTISRPTLSKYHEHSSYSLIGSQEHQVVPATFFTLLFIYFAYCSKMLLGNVIVDTQFFAVIRNFLVNIAF